MKAARKQSNIKSFRIKQQIEKIKEYEKTMLEKIERANTLVHYNVGKDQKENTESPLDSILDDYRGGNEKTETKI